MPGSNMTPIYGWPYNNRNLDPLTYEVISGEDALLAIEPTVAGIDSRLVAAEAIIATLTGGLADIRVSDAWAAVTNNFPTTTSATYVQIGTVCGVSFVAPASGIVMIDWASELQGGGTTVAGCTIEVRQGASVGSGTVVMAAADATGMARGDNVGAATSAFWHRHTGLTPGSTYNTQLLFRSNGAVTATAGRRSVRVRSQ